MTAALSIVSAENAVASLPALIDRAVSVLKSARTSAEVLEARDLAAVAYDAAKRAARFGRAKQAADSLIAAAHRSQADALLIESQAKRRLADEYDAAQERGEVAKLGEIGGGHSRSSDAEHLPATARDLGLSRKDVHEARIIRDAEEVEPGIVARTLNDAIEQGEEPTRAKVRRAVATTVKPADPETSPRVRLGRSAVCERVREAISLLTGLPPAREVAAYFRGTDDAIVIADRLPAVTAWLVEFKNAWEGTDNAGD